MTDILFINSTEDNKLHSLINGTMILATKLLQADFKVDILHFYEAEGFDCGDYGKFIEDITKKIISANPKCVSFYTTWPYYHVNLRIAQRVKQTVPDIITVMGGPHASATAQETLEAMDFIDYISTGEGENIVVPFFSSVLRNNRKNIEDIPGLFYRENGEVKFNHIAYELCDVNTVPRWDESLYTAEEQGLDDKYYYMPIDAGRGCPYNCTFCSTSLFWKRAYRLKSPERIVEDITYYNKRFGIKSFWFSHDAFTSSRRLVSEVCDRIIENNLSITWKCTARIDCISEELILKMQKAGLVHIELGVETGSPRMQKLINKNLNLEKVRSMVKFLVKNGISIKLFFMYGFPEETEEDLNQTLELYFDLTDIGVKHASMSFCRFNPMTEITDRYLDDLYIDPDIKVLSRNAFGYEEEFELIKSTKRIFPHYYHLSTPVRNNYQYIIYLAYLYRKFPNSVKHIRKYYGGDNLKLYADFCNNNADVFSSDIDSILNSVMENQVEILSNTIKNIDKTAFARISALFQYDFDLQTVVNSHEDISVQKIYSFDYVGYRMNLEVEQYSDCSTELLIRKKDGKTEVKVIAIHNA